MELTVAETARALEVSKQRVHELIDQGRIDTVRRGRFVFVTEIARARDRRVGKRVGPRPNQPATTTPAKPKQITRHPNHCDHHGAVLRRGKSCRSTVYECEIHGEATCETCSGSEKTGIPRCEQFVPLVPIARR